MLFFNIQFRYHGFVREICIFWRLVRTHIQQICVSKRLIIAPPMNGHYKLNGSKSAMPDSMVSKLPLIVRNLLIHFLLLLSSTTQTRLPGLVATYKKLFCIFECNWWVTFSFDCLIGLIPSLFLEVKRPLELIIDSYYYYDE